MEELGNTLKNLLRVMSMFAAFAVVLAMAQESTLPEGQQGTRPQSSSGASKWGPFRNTTSALAGPRASSATSSRAPHSEKEQSGLAREVANRKAPPANDSVGGTGLMPGQVGGATESSPSENSGFGTQGTIHASGGLRATQNKKHTGVFGSGKRNRRTSLGRSGLHPRVKDGGLKTKKQNW
jgi:hypothetical protein